MKKSFLKLNNLLFILLSITLSNCYTLNTHQSGKTLGKGNAIIHGIAGYSIYPDRINNPDRTYYDFSEAQAFAALGLRDDLDVGVFLGMIKTGAFVKYQFVGNQNTKFNMSGGLNAKNVHQQQLLLEYNTMQLIEMPLYISYDLNKYFTLYSNPVLSYVEISEPNYSRNFYQSGFYRGLSNGVMLTIPVEKVRFLVTIEGAWVSPMMENSYRYFITAGVGIMFPTGLLMGN